MNAEERRNAANDMVYLVTCAVNNTVPAADRLSGMNLENVFKAAGSHLLTAAAAVALESAGIHDSAYMQANAKAIRKAVLMDREMNALLEKLEDAGIWYMPLKGIVLKNFYPVFGMREMADCDILIDSSRAEDVRKIMEKQGFFAKSFGFENHDVYIKESLCCFEMHRALFNQRHDDKILTYYQNVRDHMRKDKENRFGFHFSPEDFYIYMIAHEYKHFSQGGTGLRSLLDVYVYLNKNALDMKYVRTETEKLGISDFEASNRTLSQHLFNGEELTADDREMLDYILFSGVYGTAAHRVQNAMEKNGWSKFQYMRRRLFNVFSYRSGVAAVNAGVYPFFAKHRMLIPFLPLYRVIRAVKKGRYKAEIKAVRRADKS